MRRLFKAALALAILSSVVAEKARGHQYALTDLGAAECANGINDIGQVVGGAALTSSSAECAYLWTSGGGMQNLGMLDGPFSEAIGINNVGQVVGQGTVIGNAENAFLWTSGGGMQNLGTLGGTNSTAYSINDSGQVVGKSQISNNKFHATCVRHDECHCSWPC